VAKKTRTPPPPRRVQAPQRRREPSRISPEGRRVTWLLLFAFAASGLIALGIVIGFLFIGGNNSSGNSGKASGSDLGPTVSSATLPGIQRTPPPWPVEFEKLPDRLSPIGVSALPQEALAFHIHQHLDIFVNGKKISVPASIGIFGNTFITEVHTHDASGIIHVESPENRPYSLGQVMGEWGVYFTRNCIGSMCATPQKPLHVYLNGKLFRGDFTRLKLKSHQEIAIVFGKPPKKIPKSYKFPTGT
jgi:hypothetical protein